MSAVRPIITTCRLRISASIILCISVCGSYYFGLRLVYVVPWMLSIVHVAEHGKYGLCSLVPRPPHSFCRLQYEKRGRPGISYHMNDVEGRET